MAKQSDKKCPCTCTMELFSQKWVMQIMRTMCDANSEVRFTDIKEALPDINSNTLSQRLSELEDVGLIARSVENTKPIQIRYTTTEKGAELKKIFKTMTYWSEKWQR